MQHTINALKSHLLFFEEHCPEILDNINPSAFIDESVVENLFGTLKSKSPNNVSFSINIQFPTVTEYGQQKPGLVLEWMKGIMDVGYSHYTGPNHTNYKAAMMSDIAGLLMIEKF